MRASLYQFLDPSPCACAASRVRRFSARRRFWLGIGMLLALGLTQGCHWLKSRGLDIHNYRPVERSSTPAASKALPAPTPTPTAAAKPPAGATARPGNPEAWGEGAQITAGRDFEPIYFSEESAELDFAARRRLANVVQWLHEHPNVWVSLAGHTGDRATVSMAYNLGMARALVVQDFLIGQGLDLRRFFPISFGRDRPAAEGTTPEAESLNNRVELLAFIAPIGQDAPEPVAVEKEGAPPAEQPRLEARPRQDIP